MTAMAAGTAGAMERYKGAQLTLVPIQSDIKWISGLADTILQSVIQGGRRRGRQKKKKGMDSFECQ